ncbi:hypothetical protein SO802_017430 [Lithocarpus litseifolius]|uniref:Uncharacterized protein n=1 Tax=Lithocarpus litseifolius TaxID=425828 RepID=A0AAW2CI57_9ROSI
MQTAMPMPSSKVSLKLFIHKGTNRVLFAEAGKEFVDFFDNILRLPVGALIKLLKPERVLGFLGNIHDSIINLTADLEPDEKDSRLKPNVHFSGDIGLPRRVLNILFNDAKYPSRGSRRRSELKYCAPKGVKEAPYLVMNDLEVKPLSTVSLVTLLNKFHLLKDGDLEEKVVDLGMDEGLKLLKASLESKNVLTEVFLLTVKQEV